MERINYYIRRITFFNHILKHFDEKNYLESSILVIGCGTGLEALCLQNSNLNSIVVGIDVDPNRLLNEVKNKINLIICDALSLSLRNDVFDVSYCYHVLEHVTSSQKCIEEIKRSLKNNGSLFLATPNRRRLLAYIYSAEKKSLNEIIVLNLHEWIARLRGDFIPIKHHVGFYEEELIFLLHRFFPRVIRLTTEYNLFISKNSLYEPLIKILNFIGILRLITISHTFYCHVNT